MKGGQQLVPFSLGLLLGYIPHPQIWEVQGTLGRTNNATSKHLIVKLMNIKKEKQLKVDRRDKKTHYFKGSNDVNKNKLFFENNGSHKTVK